MITNLKLWGLAILAFMGGAIKILLMMNKAKAKEIETLEENAETVAKIHNDDLKRENFKASQEEKAKQANDDTDLARELARRGEVKHEDGYTITKL